MGITPHGILISNAYTSTQDHKEYPKNYAHSKHSNCFSPSEEIPTREVGRDTAGISVQEAQEHFLEKLRLEQGEKKELILKRQIKSR